MPAVGTRRAWALTLGGRSYATLRVWEGRRSHTEEFSENLRAPYAVLAKDAARTQKAAKRLDISHRLITKKTRENNRDGLLFQYPKIVFSFFRQTDKKFNLENLDAVRILRLQFFDET